MTDGFVSFYTDPTVFGVPHFGTQSRKAVSIHGRGSHELGLESKPFEGVRPVITKVVSIPKNIFDRLDDKIEEHARQRDFYFAALANETESPARARVLSSVMLHTEIVHTLWDIFDRHGDCPCGMCDQNALMILYRNRHQSLLNLVCWIGVGGAQPA
jgi:hypothetical protein